MLQEPVQQKTTGVAIIGAGERGIYYVGSRMAEIAAETGFRIIGVFDRLEDRAGYAADHLNALYGRAGIHHAVRVFESLDAAVADPAVDLVIVTTHTNAHRAPVEAAIAAGKRVYLDKPISVTLDDAEAIQAAEAKAGQPVLMAFTRRYEKPWVETVKLAHSGRIGDPQMILLRSVIPYTRYLQLWHRKQALSGGALNDKCSHHFDVLNWVARARPLSVTAIGGRSNVFPPDPNAPERCSLCDRDCPYRRHETLVDRFEGAGAIANPSWGEAALPEDRNDTCVYRPGADIDDHAIVTIRYENGVSACLFFAIFGPWAEDQETLEIVGSSGRIRMERHSGEIDIVEDYGRTHGTLGFTSPDRSSTHFGADLELVRTLRRFMDGENPPVGIDDGVASLRIVLAAQKSMKNGGMPVDPETQEFAK